MYSWLGYKGPFLLYAIVFLIFGISVKKILPTTVDLRVGEEEDESKNQDEKPMEEKPIFEKDEDFVMDIDGGEQIQVNPSINLQNAVDKDKSLGEDRSKTPSPRLSAQVKPIGKQVTFCGLFTQLKVLFACFSGSLAYFSYS